MHILKMQEYDKRKGFLCRNYTWKSRQYKSGDSVDSVSAFYVLHKPEDFEHFKSLGEQFLIFEVETREELEQIAEKERKKRVDDGLCPKLADIYGAELLADKPKVVIEKPAKKVEIKKEIPKPKQKIEPKKEIAKPVKKVDVEKLKDEPKPVDKKPVKVEEKPKKRRGRPRKSK